MDIRILQHCVVIRPPAASITLLMSRSAWLGTAEVAADIEEENVQVKAMLATPGQIVRRPQSHQKLHDYMANNQHVKHGNIQNM